MGWASSPVWGVSALARYGTVLYLRVSHLFNSIALTPLGIFSAQTHRKLKTK